LSTGRGVVEISILYKWCEHFASTLKSERQFVQHGDEHTVCGGKAPQEVNFLTRHWRCCTVAPSLTIA
jgi:hypothetical protein